LQFIDEVRAALSAWTVRSRRVPAPAAASTGSVIRTNYVTHSRDLFNAPRVCVS
jgi:hypothetical protein